MPTITTSRGLKWHYDIEGKGDPILFIHGFGGSGRWWCNQTDMLKKDFQIITLDLPGHGYSGWMPLTLTDIAVDIRQILNHLGVDQFTVVASSMGGLIAFELYRLTGHQVMRMSLVGALPKFGRGPQYPAGLDIDKIRKLSKQFEEGSYASVLDIFFRSLFTIKERQSTRKFDLKKLRETEPLPQREALKVYLDMLENVDLRDRLSSVICPLQFITGREDYICPPSMMDWISQHTYNARFDIMEHCGHLPFLTEVDEYNRLLDDFLIS